MTAWERTKGRLRQRMGACGKQPNELGGCRKGRSGGCGASWAVRAADGVVRYTDNLGFKGPVTQKDVGKWR
jgi:hypothetical protein